MVSLTGSHQKDTTAAHIKLFRMLSLAFFVFQQAKSHNHTARLTQPYSKVDSTVEHMDRVPMPDAKHCLLLPVTVTHLSIYTAVRGKDTA